MFGNPQVRIQNLEGFSIFKLFLNNFNFIIIIAYFINVLACPRDPRTKRNDRILKQRHFISLEPIRADQFTDFVGFMDPGLDETFQNRLQSPPYVVWKITNHFCHSKTT